MLLLALSACFFKPGLGERPLYVSDYLSQRPPVHQISGAPCNPTSRLVVDLLPAGTTVLASHPGGACSPMQVLAPVGVVAGSSKLVFELGDPRQLGDVATFLPGAVPGHQLPRPMWIRGESVAALPVYIDGVRHMRAGMLR